MAENTKQLAFGNAKAIDEALGKVAGIELKVGEFSDASHDDVCTSIVSIESQLDGVEDLINAL